MQATCIASASPLSSAVTHPQNERQLLRMRPPKLLDNPAWNVINAAALRRSFSPQASYLVTGWISQTRGHIYGQSSFSLSPVPRDVEFYISRYTLNIKHGISGRKHSRCTCRRRGNGGSILNISTFPGRLPGPMYRGGRGRRRHLVLEHLPRRHERYRILSVPLFMG